MLCCKNDNFLVVAVYQIVNAGNFWARPIGRHGEEIQNVLGKLNDFIRNNSTPQLQPKKGQVSTVDVVLVMQKRTNQSL